MKRIYRYKIYKKLHLILLYYQNELTINELKSILRLVKEDKDYNSSFDLLVDFRNTVLNLTINDLNEYGKNIKDNPLIIDKSLKVFLTETPQHVVFTSLFRESEDMKNRNYRIFSTLKTSFKYLGIGGKDCDRIEGDINKMRE